MVVLLLSLALAGGPPAPTPLALRCGAMVDVEAGRTLGSHVIVVEAGRIREILPGTKAPARTEPVDLSTRTCAPGLIDLHVHLAFSPGPRAYEEGFRLDPADLALRAAMHAKQTVEAGFTTVRDLGAPDGVVLSLRDAIAAGWVTGPRILAAGKSIATGGGHADPTNGVRAGLLPEPGPPQGVIAGPDEARAAVRERYQEGADCIKITATGGVLSLASSVDNPQFSDAELEALIAAAKDYGFHVAAHAHGNEGALRAVRAGVHTIEHGTFLSDEVLSLMATKGTWLIPTLTAGSFVTQQAAVEGYYPDVVRPKARTIGPRIALTFRHAVELGVRWANGSDAGVFPHGDNARELVLAVQAGLPPADVLAAATTRAAEVLGLQADTGRLAPGLRADVVAFDGDPLAEIEAVQRVRFVLRDGRVLKADRPAQ